MAGKTARKNGRIMGTQALTMPILHSTSIQIPASTIVPDQVISI